MDAAAAGSYSPGMARSSSHAPAESPRPISGSLRTFARGAAGGLLVAMPLLVTMEMWWHGFVMGPWKMLLFLSLNFLLLIALEYYSGFTDEGGFRQVVKDAVIAYGIAAAVATAVLWLLTLLRGEIMSVTEMVGKIILETIAVSLGVAVADSQTGGGDQGQRKRRDAGFWGTQLIAAGGAVVFGFNVAPTIEPMMLGLKLQWWHALGLMSLTLLVTHGMVYQLDFGGPKEMGAEAGLLRQVFGYSAVSYAVALVVAAYLLWSFGRIGPDTGFAAGLHMVIVLGFVTGVGAAAARIVL